MLFIIPYSVIDEIINDPTHSLARDTTHRAHYPQISTWGSHVGSSTNPNLPTDYMAQFSIPQVVTSIHHQNSFSRSQNQSQNQSQNPSISNDDKSKHVQFSSPPRHSAKDSLLNSKIDENYDELDGGQENNDHEKNAQTMHIKNIPSSLETNKNDDGDGYDGDNDKEENKKEKEKEKKKKGSHHTGLTHILAGKLNIVTGGANRSRSASRDEVPDESPKLTPNELASDDNIATSNDFDLDGKATTNLNSDNSPTSNSHDEIDFDEPFETTRKLKKPSVIDPNLLRASKIRPRESALRDSLHFHSNKLKRISSMAPGLAIPQFERKIFLDFKLFDDSGIEQRSNNDDEYDDHNIFSFNPGNTSASNVYGNHSTKNIYTRKISRNRTKSHHKKVHSGPNSALSKKEEIIRNYNLTHNKAVTPQAPDPLTKNLSLELDDGMSGGSDSEEEKYDNNDHNKATTPPPPDNKNYNSNKSNKVSTPHSPTTTMLNDSAGIYAGEGTFLGSCHLSVNLDEPDTLKTFHHTIHEKEIKIGRKRNENQKSGKLKFKVYCNALSAYLKHGKGYGDKILEHELQITVKSIPQHSSADSNNYDK